MSMSQSSSPTQSTTTYGPRSLIVMSLGCALLGGFFYMLYGRLGDTPSEIAEQVTQQSTDSEATTQGDFQRQLDDLTRLHTQIAETLSALDHETADAAKAHAAAAKARNDARIAYREFIKKQAEAAGFKVERPMGTVILPRQDK